MNNTIAAYGNLLIWSSCLLQGPQKREKTLALTCPEQRCDEFGEGCQDGYNCPDFVVGAQGGCCQKDHAIHFQTQRLSSSWGSATEGKLEMVMHNLTLMDRTVTYVVPKRLSGLSGIVTGVLSTGGDVHDLNRRQVIRDTWAKDRQVFFIVEAPDALEESSLVQIEARTHGDMILLAMSASYKMMTFKTIGFLYLVHQFAPRVHYSFKADDDAYVNMSSLEHAISQSSPGYWGQVYWGVKPIRNPEEKHFVSIDKWNESTFPAYCGGPGFVVSRDFVDCIVRKMPSHKFVVTDDIELGILAKECQIIPTLAKGVYLNATDRAHATNQVCALCDDIIFHPLPAETMAQYARCERCFCKNVQGVC